MSILGKRSRRSCEQQPPVSSTSPISTRSSRAKRRTTQDSFVIVSDEEEDPFVTTRPKRKRTSNPKYVGELDDLSIENTPQAKTLKLEKSPSKHLQDLPTTPRHRDAAGKKVAITPRHRVGLLARPSTPQSNQTPTTPRISLPSTYNDARTLFKNSLLSSKIIGREKEKSEISTFIEKRLQSRSSGCLYVSGPPGTGKSALVNEVCDLLKDANTFEFSYCNCMSVKSTTDIFSTILDDFGMSDVMQGTELDHLRKTFQSKKGSHLVILDEIDHLLDIDISLLYQVFEWSLQKSSSLILVGIANALDLTDRFLPRLKSKNLRPHLIPFMPYSVADITLILNTKLKSLLPETHSAAPDYVPFVHPTAILFLAKKVAAQTGDLRKAFAVCLRSLDLVEFETHNALANSLLTPSASPSPTKSPLRENPFLSSPSTTKSPRKRAVIANPLAHLRPDTAPRATIAHVARVTAAVFSNGLSQRLSNLNIQQKAALCALAALESHSRDTADLATPLTPSSKSKQARAPTVRALYDAYARLCRQENALAPLTATEFRDVLAGLETLSLVNPVNGGKTGGLNVISTPSRRGRGKAIGADNAEDVRVASVVGIKELKGALTGVGSNILMAIVDGEVF